MKKFLFLCLLTLGAMTTFTACGGDDEDNQPKNEQQGTENGTNWSSSSSSGFADKGSYMYVTYSRTLNNMTITITWTCYFDDNNICTSSKEETTFPTAELAKLSYDETIANLEEGEDPGKYSVSGKVVTYDATDDCKGQSKDVIKAAMQAIANKNK